MSARELFQRNARVQGLVESIVQSGCLTFNRAYNGRIEFGVDTWKLPPDLMGFVNFMLGEGMSSILEMAVQGYAYHEGLKVVTINQLDAEALENTRLNFLVGDYNQPFQTLFVDLPESFFQKHEVACPQGGDIYGGEEIPNRHYPHTVGLRHYKNDKFGYIIAAIYFTSYQAFTVLIDASVEGDTIEDVIALAFDPARQLKNSRIIASEEDSVTQAALRVALNTVLILEREGIRKLGPSDPRHYNRLAKNLHKSCKRGDSEEKIQRAKQVLLAEPVYYTFDQHVVIYHHEDGCDQGDILHEPTGRIVRPHWRSGHYRVQHYGTGNLQSKRVRIPSVLVNKHRFLGQLKDTTASYEIRK